MSAEGMLGGGGSVLEQGELLAEKTSPSRVLGMNFYWHT